jgi:hypothetical protein
VAILRSPGQQTRLRKTSGPTTATTLALRKSIYRPQWSSVCMVASSPIYSLSNYTMNQFITTTGQAVQLNLQEWGSVGMNYHVGSAIRNAGVWR